ncbi:MAG: DUF4058 family protein [Gemmataceae bacterium]
MASPFPGMDPYLEEPGIWEDLHTTLIVAIRADINPRLPKGYIAATDRHVWIEGARPRKRRKRSPDVYVVKDRKRPGGAAPALLTAPRTISLPVVERKGKPYVKIVDTRERRVVTVLELLSPTNKKAGEHYAEYVAKREEYLASGVNMVEINLLCGGQPPPLGELEGEELAYYILVCRAPDQPEAKVWPFTVRDPIPEFPIPLSSGAEIAFKLKPCLDRAYEEARFGDEVDYARPPVPPFASGEAQWVREVARGAVKR